MIRHSACLCVIIFTACAPAPSPTTVERGSATEVEDGGMVANADRETAEAFFVALGKVKSVEEEEELLTEFGEWLVNKEYKIRVEVKNEEHHLSCPHFPPETPWTSHSFLDIKNLDLLPRLNDAAY